MIREIDWHHYYMVDEASNLCASNDVTPFYLSDVLFCLFVLRQYCVEKKHPLTLKLLQKEVDS